MLHKISFQLSCVIIASMLFGVSFAQEESTLPPTEIPIAKLISISEIEDSLNVMVVGDTGAVPPNAEVEVKNLFTDESVIAQAAGDGSFSVELYAPGNPPLWIRADESAMLLNPALNGETFSIGGILSKGAANWTAEGLIEHRDNTLHLRLNITAFAPDLSDSIDDLRMLGELYLMPIIDSEGLPVPMNEGSWARLKTLSGLPVFENHELIKVAEAEAINIFRVEETLHFRLRFEESLPVDLADGIYLPVFHGLGRISNSEIFTWVDNIVFGVDGESSSGDEFVRLPATLTIGDADQLRLLWSLFYDEFSDGNQGTISLEDSSFAGLSNTVRFNSANLILSPDHYPIEPYLLDFPSQFVVVGGEIQAVITAPDGGTTQLPTADIQQVIFDLSGANQPRLTTLDPQYTAFPFDQYGTYTIELTGFIEDAYGNRYAGGGSYQVLIAELLDLTPGVLPGTPFEIGDSFYFGAMIQPQFPADVSTTIQSFPSPYHYTMQRSFEEKANQWGVFNTPFVELDDVAEYFVDYEARYTDEQGRLWAASLRTAGVISDPETELILHGRRGIDGYDRDPRAWFNTTVYPADEPRASQRPYFPFYSGDVAWIPDVFNSGIYPIITSEQEINYSYISAVRPDASLRQYIVVDDIDAAWTGEDQFLGQIGVGEAGNQPGDYTLLFGGAISNETSAGYAATAIIVAEDQPAIVQPPFGVSSARDPLFTIQDEPIELFFHPTATQPGHILALGEQIIVAGQIIPTVPADVAITITSPAGERYVSSSTTNSIGYYFDPMQPITVDEVGIWRVSIDAIYDGMTSAGLVEPPYPSGGTLGEFLVYVVPPDDELLNVNVDPALRPLDFTLAIPSDWTEITAYHTVRTASHVLSSGELASNRYIYDAATLDNDFTMLDDADVVSFSFAVTGRDADGQPTIQVRSFTLMGGELLSILSE